jgi:2-methylisocitrate lyase-like PEP mutase family enzyme
MTVEKLPDRSAEFLALHQPGNPLLLPNPWDIGSAKILASLGFRALATTSSGFAATLGRPDGSVSRDEALAHAAAIASATELPVNADLENGFAADPGAVAETIRRAIAAGVAGASIEDHTGQQSDPIYELSAAVDRVAAAAEAAHSGDRRLILTARAENYLHGRVDLTDTIERLVRYQEAGADVVYAPGLIRSEDITAVVGAVAVPVNVLALAAAPPVAALADLGVARVSVGGAFAYGALGALTRAALEFRDQGTYGFTGSNSAGREAARSAFG